MTALGYVFATLHTCNKNKARSRRLLSHFVFLCVCSMCELLAYFRNTCCDPVFCCCFYLISSRLLPSLSASPIKRRPCHFRILFAPAPEQQKSNPSGPPYSLNPGQTNAQSLQASLCSKALVIKSPVTLGFFLFQSSGRQQPGHSSLLFSPRSLQTKTQTVTVSAHPDHG